jgi:hypothetical protein
MGVSRHIHLGPYIEVFFEKEKVEHDFCRRKGECPDSAAPFCPTCGIERSRRFSSWNAIPEFHEMFERGEPLSMIGECQELEDSNRMIACLRSNLRSPRDFSGEDDLDSEDFSIEDEKSWMWNEFSDEIDVLKEKFGSANVDVRWGYFTWWY